MPFVPSVQFSSSSDSVPTSKATNDAMPRLSGFGDPNAIVRMSVDGQEVGMGAMATEWGNWTLTSPELADGEHTFEVWQEDPNTGERGEVTQWTDTVQASEADRAAQRQRNEQWQSGGSRDWRAAEDEREKNAEPPKVYQPPQAPLPPIRPLTPTPTTAAGGGQPAGVGVMPGGGEPIGVGGVTTTPRDPQTPPQPQGLEKGNATS